jgi:splicing factor 3B subunit 1
LLGTPGKRSRWGETPKWGGTPRADSTPGRTSEWGETPRADRGGVAETPSSKRKSRWDETPSSQRQGVKGTPIGGTPSIMGGATPNFSAKTPAGAMAMGLQTPSAGK